MTLMQRIRKILGALFMIFCARVVLFSGEDGFLLIALIICLTLMFNGLRSLYFYFTMARHMVDGRGSLYIGLILLDLGIFTLTIMNDPSVFIILYILAVNAFTGTIDILRALEARKMQAPSWRWNLLSGVISILFALAAVICGFVFKDMKVLLIIYVIGMLWTAATKLVSAFRTTAIVYIP